jgi:hypothetical protein
MQAAKYTLLVIDLLNDYFRRHACLAAQRSQLVASVNRLAAENYPPARIITKVRPTRTGAVRFSTTERGSPCPAA